MTLTAVVPERQIHLRHRRFRRYTDEEYTGNMEKRSLILAREKFFYSKMSVLPPNLHFHLKSR